MMHEYGVEVTVVELMDSLLPEMEPKLGQALAGVFERGEFTKTESCNKAKDEWRLNCDQVQQFAEECCVFEPGAEVLSSLLFKEYKEWAEGAGVRKTMNRNNFTARICRLGAERSRRKGGTRTLAGIRLKRISKGYGWSGTAGTI